jgi:Rv2525c-like, glycoside hydrolase-like domain
MRVLIHSPIPATPRWSRFGITQIFIGADSISVRGSIGGHTSPRSWTSVGALLRSTPASSPEKATSHKLQAIKARHAGHPDDLAKALYNNGKADGKEAIHQARTAKIPTATIIYFDVENTVPDSAWLTYYRGWSRAVVDQYYRVGLYTRAAHASWVTSQLMNMPGFDVCFPCIWIAKYTRANPNGTPVPARDYLETPFPTPTPANAGGGATSWQHLGNFGMKWTDESHPGKTQHFRHAPVDFDTSIFSDPGRGILSRELVAWEVG